MSETQTPEADLPVHLVIIEASGDGARFTFPLSKAQLRIGRALENDVVLAETSVSRLHASITLGLGRCVIEDRGSRTGTLVNGELVSAAHELRSGDIVRIGATLMRFEADAAAPEPFDPTETPADALAVLSLSEPGVGPRQQALARGVFSIGRDPRCDVVLGGQQIAPFQAMLTITDSEWRVAPLTPTPATLLNGAPLTGPARLGPRDILRLGAYAVQLVSPSVTSDDEAVAGGARVELMQTMIASSAGLAELGEGHALVCLSGGARGMRYPLGKGRTLIGSGADCVVRISSLPPRALSLTRTDGGFAAQVEAPELRLRISGGRKLPCVLQRGDLLELDGSVLRLVSASDAFSARYDEADFQSATPDPRPARRRRVLVAALLVAALLATLFWLSR